MKEKIMTPLLELPYWMRKNHEHPPIPTPQKYSSPYASKIWISPYEDCETWINTHEASILTTVDNARINTLAWDWQQAAVNGMHGMCGDVYIFARYSQANLKHMGH